MKLAPERTRFEILAGLLFAASLVSKILSFLHGVAAPDIDPVSGSSPVRLFILAVILDSAGLLACLLPIARSLRGGGLALVGSVYLAYHAFGLLIARAPSCDCFAGLSSAVGAPRVAGVILAVAAAIYLLLRGFTLLGIEDFQFLHRYLRPKIRATEPGSGGRLGQCIVIVLCAITALTISIEAPIASAIEFDGDEQLELVKAQLLSHRYHLYDEIWSDQPPLLTYFYRLLAAFSGSSVVAPRAFSFGCFLLLLAIPALDLNRRFGAVAAGLYAFLLPTVPEVVSVSLSATREVPMTLFAMLGVVSGRWFLGSGRGRHLLMSGAFFVAAILIKMLAIAFLLPLSAMLLLDRSQIPLRKRCWASMALLLGAPGLALISVWIGFGWSAVQQMTITHYGFQHVEGIPDPANFGFGAAQIMAHPVLYLLSLAAGVWLCRGRRWIGCSYELLLLLALLLMAAVVRPWWDYYHLELGLALSLVCAIGASSFLRHCRARLCESGRPYGFVPPAAAAWSFLLALAMLFSAGLNRWGSNLDFLRGRVLLRESEWIRALRGLETEVQWAFSPESIYLYHTGLKVPPELAVLSLKRFWTGQMSFSRMRRVLEKYRPEVIAVTHEDAKGGLSWVSDLGYRLAVHGRECLVYVRPDVHERLTGRRMSANPASGPKMRPGG